MDQKEAFLNPFKGSNVRPNIHRIFSIFIIRCIFPVIIGKAPYWLVFVKCLFESHGKNNQIFFKDKWGYIRTFLIFFQNYNNYIRRFLQKKIVQGLSGRSVVDF